MRYGIVLLVSVLSAGQSQASGWYVQETFATPKRYVPLTNERHTFEVGGLSCWVSEPTYLRIDDATKAGASYVAESREMGCAFPSGHEAFVTVTVPQNPKAFEVTMETLQIRESGTLVAPTLAWSNIRLLGEGE